MSIIPKELMPAPDAGVTVIQGWQDAVDRVKALVVQKLTEHFTANPTDESIDNWHDVRDKVISMCGAIAKAKLLAANPRVFNDAFDQLIAEGVLVSKPPKATAETAPDVP